MQAEEQKRESERKSVAGEPITWEELTRREPRLLALKREIEQLDNRKGDYFCMNERWYGEGPYIGRGLRDRMAQLVGFLAKNRQDPVLGTSTAYEVAYFTLYYALPDCRHCPCTGWYTTSESCPACGQATGSVDRTGRCPQCSAQEF